MVRLTCEHCGEFFLAATNQQRFCGQECREDGYDRASRAYAEPLHVMTHEEIARELGCSRQLVQRIESKALAKLRYAMRDYR